MLDMLGRLGIPGIKSSNSAAEDTGEGFTGETPETGDGRVPVSFFDGLVALIILVSFCALALLALHIFTPTTALLGGAGLWLALFALLRNTLAFQRPRVDMGLALILLLALVFRTGPYPWVLGAQDQGIYSNMSAYFERHHGPFIVDPIRRMLTGEERRYYDRHAHQLKGSDFELHGTYPQLDSLAPPQEKPQASRPKRPLNYLLHLQGIFIKDAERSEYLFQFYHLHPLLMSVFSGLAGFDARFYSVTFFSLLSIAAFFLLAREISGGRRSAAYLIALFLAIHPLHAFFGKFPISEEVFLFFTACGFYYLARASRREWEGDPLSLALSAGLFACAFFTRISGFLYLPFFYGLFIFAMIHRRGYKNPNTIGRFYAYFCAIVAAYALSVAYGYFYSQPYTLLVYESVSTLLSRSGGIIITAAGAVVLVTLSFGAYAMGSMEPQGRTVLSVSLKKWLPIAGALVLLTTLLYGFFDLYCAYAIAGKKYARYWMIVHYCIYLTPAGCLALLGALYFNVRERNGRLTALVFFAALFTAYVVFPRPRGGYQFYYGRYLLSEIIPYTLLLIAVYLSAPLQRSSGKGRRVLALVFILAICAPTLFFTANQLRGREGATLYRSLKEIKAQRRRKRPRPACLSRRAAHDGLEILFRHSRPLHA